jgi:hypothetical protein
MRSQPVVHPLSQGRLHLVWGGGIPKYESLIGALTGCSLKEGNCSLYFRSLSTGIVPAHVPKSSAGFAPDPACCSSFWAFGPAVELIVFEKNEVGIKNQKR